MSLPDIPQPWLAQAKAICHTGRRLDQLGYVHGSAGNISVKLPADPCQGYIITPTDACLGQLEPTRLAMVDQNGKQLFGDQASKTLTLHRGIYDADPLASAVIHTHSYHLVLLTLLGVWSADEIVPPITPYQVMKVGRVPLIGYALPGDAQVVAEVTTTIRQAAQQGEQLRAVMCERLGPQVWHADLKKAAAVLEELEQTARLWLAGERRIEPLSPAQIKALRQRFSNK